MPRREAAERCRCGRFLHNIPAIHGAYWVCPECFLFDHECRCKRRKTPIRLREGDTQ